MRASDRVVDVVVVGAGPIGIACGLEARRAGLEPLVFDKGALTHSLCQYPGGLVWFSTPELLEIGDVPLICANAKPTGPELIRYYRRVAEHFRLSVRLYEAVVEMRRDASGLFEVQTARGRTERARSVVIASGFFDFPNLIGIPGEGLDKVSHYYDTAFPYYGQRVAVIGGGNSAVEAALDLYRGGAREVTLVHRRAELARRIKYWLLPDIENRIREGSVRAYFESRVASIEPEAITIEQSDGTRVRIENDFVLALTGYHPDVDFLRRAGIDVDDATWRPQHDAETLETNVPGLYCAGVVTGGKDTGKIFIENSRVPREEDRARHRTPSRSGGVAGELITYPVVCCTSPSL